MRLRHVPAVLAAGVMGLAAEASAVPVDNVFHEWYPCSTYTVSDGTDNGDNAAECAMFAAPLCYPGICEAPTNAKPTIDVFVKRLSASVGDAEKASNVWLIAGGPGAPSTDLEYLMETLNWRLEGAVNVYTMDHRGTGRSTLLDCVSSQNKTSGSASSRLIDISEVPSCAEELHAKYGDLSSFSTTSAATDIAAFISAHTNGASTVVFGVSYGTMVAQRLMHLNPLNVTGYVLDSVVTFSGAPNDMAHFTNMDADFGDVGERFMALCGQDSDCSSHFSATSVSTTLHNVLSAFEMDPNSTCAALIRNVSEVEPSVVLRRTLGRLIKDSETRLVIPPLVYRLHRCDVDDVGVLTHFFESRKALGSKPHGDPGHMSVLLHYLILFSEMWETPSPSYTELQNRLADVNIASGAAFYTRRFYCAFSKEKSPGCEEPELGNYEAGSIIYARDQFWNKTALIPKQASVLLMNGKLDPLAHYRYATSLFESLDTPRKKLILFDYAPHSMIDSTFFDDDEITCGVELLASYVANNGDLERLDKSCIAKMPVFDMTLTPGTLDSLFGTNEAYDGVFIPANLSESV